MGERIIIPAGTTINEGDHEDGDGLTLNKNLEAEVVGVAQESGSLKVVIEEIDPDRVLFVHQPPVKKD